jgi:hypothetical protein
MKKKETLFHPFISLLKRLLVGAHFEFFEKVIRRIEQKVALVPVLQGAYNNLVLVFAHEDAVYKKHLLYESDEMVAMDSWRAGIIFRLFAEIKGRMRSYIENEKKAASLLYKEIVLPYKSPGEQLADVKEAYITNMLTAFSNPKYQAAITLLNLQSILSELISAHNTYTTTMDEKSKAQNLIQALGTSKEACEHTDQAFEELTEDIAAIRRANEMQDKDEDLRDNLNSIIFFINSTIDETRWKEAHRQKRSKKKPDGTTEDEGTQTNDDANEIEDINERKDESTDTENKTETENNEHKLDNY